MINNVVLIGRLTKNPDLRYTSNSVAVTTFALAVKRNFTNQNGNREADFINCVIWRKPAEKMANYAKKGTLLGIVGRIQTRSYENQQGQRVYVTEVICENFQLLESHASIENRKKQEDIEQQSCATNLPGQEEIDEISNQKKKSNDMTDYENNPHEEIFGRSATIIDISDDDYPF